MNSLFALEPLTTVDVSSLHAFLASNKKEFLRFFPITLGQNETIKDSENYILHKSDQIKLKTEFTFAIKANKTVVGLLILKNLNWELKRGEIAYCIDKNYQGRGWITRAVKEITSFALNDLGLKSLEIIVSKLNKASIRVAEKCGYKWTKTLLKGFIPPNEEPIDMELYERSNEK
ncbi:GNAT family N-acetyltransferase [Eudoraea adriatica]|uniref:GNAT family N-acetyltransferase n=1 Tax=Eudoraea adriatica TaxID=446681 RepID=UPI0012F8E38F|nr:GNAT family N-acetyltransferase [Eudoraea adriatica]